jgi:hypothetical protein
VVKRCVVAAGKVAERAANCDPADSQSTYSMEVRLQTDRLNLIKRVTGMYVIV